MNAFFFFRWTLVWIHFICLEKHNRKRKNFFRGKTYTRFVHCQKTSKRLYYIFFCSKAYHYHAEIIPFRIFSFVNALSCRVCDYIKCWIKKNATNFLSQLTRTGIDRRANFPALVAFWLHFPCVFFPSIYKINFDQKEL